MIEPLDLGDYVFKDAVRTKLGDVDFEKDIEINDIDLFIFTREKKEDFMIEQDKKENSYGK